MSKKFFIEIKQNISKEDKDTLDKVYLDSLKKINGIKQEIENVEQPSESEYAKYFVSINKELKSIKKNIFKKCCDIEGINESKDAFCLYRDFLMEYNEVLYIYNISIKEKMGNNIKQITDTILELEKKLLPINNRNIELHSQHHLYNEPYNKEIEKLEKEREDLLYTI